MRDFKAVENRVNASIQVENTVIAQVEVWCTVTRLCSI